MLPGECPIGTVVAYAGPVVEQGLSDNDTARIRHTLFRQGWLVCDGAKCARGPYHELYVVIGNRYGGDDETFNLPDLRGLFVRGVESRTKNDDETNAPRDPLAPRSVGSIQQDAFQGHEHHYQATMPAVFMPGEAKGLTEAIPPTTATTTDVVEESGYGDPRYAVETRPVNIALNYLIRFR